MKQEIPIELYPQIAEVVKRFGFKAPSMDDFAKQLGRSKKILYKYFKNKEDMVNSFVKGYVIQIHKDQIDQLENYQDQNAILLLIQLFTHNIQILKQFPPNILNELSIYFPNAYKLVQEFKYTEFHGVLMENLNTGIQQGLYRADMNVDMVARLFISCSDSIFNEELFPALDYPKILLIKEHFLLNINGFLSVQGKQEFAQYETLIHNL